MIGKRTGKVLPIALMVFFFCLAVFLVGGECYVNITASVSSAPKWLIELNVLILKASMTGLVSPFVSAILFPFVFLGLKLLGPSMRAKISDYALACMFGCSVAITLCAATTAFEAPKGDYAATWHIVTQSAEASARNNSYVNVIWGQLSDLKEKGRLLVFAEYFVDHVCNFVTPGILLPPMFLYIWKRRKTNSNL